MCDVPYFALTISDRLFAILLFDSILVPDHGTAAIQFYNNYEFGLIGPYFNCDYVWDFRLVPS